VERLAAQRSLSFGLRRHTGPDANASPPPEAFQAWIDEHQRLAMSAPGAPTIPPPLAGAWGLHGKRPERK
jgi:hypothetical protein